MTILKNILNLFSSSDKITQPSQISDESKERVDIKFNDLGKFTYEDDGFIFQFKSGQQKIKWTDIERLIAYKQDLLTTDEICLDIVYNNWQTTITEETPGWYQFIEKTKLIFSSIPKNWDSEIVRPAFATNLSILYQRADREIPDENNFYASFTNTDKTRLKELLEQNDWTIRKSSWTDFELGNSWTELILQGSDNEPLLSGRVAFHKDNIILLNNLFDSLDGQYKYEFYDKQKNIILEKKNGS
jgi:hypothetical protein